LSGAAGDLKTLQDTKMSENESNWCSFSSQRWIDNGLKLALLNRKRAARTATFLNVQASVFLHHNEDGDADDAPGGSEETC
jgi:hypothetical protein